MRTEPVYIHISITANAYLNVILTEKIEFENPLKMTKITIISSFIIFSLTFAARLCHGCVGPDPCPTNSLTNRSFPMANQSEYLLFALRGEIGRLDLATHQVESFGVVPLNNVAAIEMDVRRNCVFWSEKDYSIIARKCLDGQNKREILAKVDVNDVTALAYDWLSEVLYFINGGHRTIDAINTAKCARQSRTRMQRTIVRAENQTRFFTLAVHPGQAYLFWCEKYELTGDVIVRSNLDGSNIWELIRLPDAYHPYVITIDHQEERIYWMDDSRGYIGRCSFDGELCEKVIWDDDEQFYFTSRHMVVHGEYVFWYDWMDRSIRRAKKEKHGVGKAIRRNLFELNSMKVVTNDLQQGDNECSRGEHKCSHICVGTPEGGHRCLCPDGMNMTTNGKCYCRNSDNEEDCSTFKRRCAPGQFQCRMHGKCIDA